MIRTVLLTSAILACIGIPRASEGVVFSDGDFNNADWSETLSASSQSGNAVIGQSETGGSPGSYRTVEHNIITSSGLVQVFHLRSTFTYDPSVQGAIDSVAWSIDYNNAQIGQAAAIAIEQDGNFHIADVFVTTLSGTGSWNSHSTPTLVEDDFGGDPDFSASGAPITFGFFTANSGQVGSFITGYDNLMITISSILPGDLDGDGFVGINDLNIVLGNWNQNVPPANPLADPSGDGFVGIDDLNAVLGNWNAGTPPSSTSSIPEPGTLGLVMLCSGLLSIHRRGPDV